MVQVKLGALPETVAGSQEAPPLMVYSHPVTALSLSVTLVVRVDGLLTKPPNWLPEAVTGPGVGAVVSRRAMSTVTPTAPDVELLLLVS